GIGELAFAGGVDHGAGFVGEVHAVVVELLLNPAADLAGVLVVLGGAGHGAVALENLRFALVVRERREGARGPGAAVLAGGRGLVGGVADELRREPSAGFALVFVDGHGVRGK